MAKETPDPSKRSPRAAQEPAVAKREAAASITAAEIRKIEPRSIEVADGETLDLSADHPRYGDCVRRVRITGHADLQMLGLVPRGLSAEKLRAAIKADDAEAYRIASGMAERQVAAADCGCDEATPGRRANPVRSAMAGLRARHNPSLARELSEHYGTRVGYDSPLASLLRKVTERFEFEKVDLGMIHLRDITIGRNATLSIAPGTVSMAARHIYIEESGTLRLNAGYTKIWANSIGRFRLRLDRTVMELGAKMTPIWLDD